MRRYEALVICDAKLEEGDTQKAVERFTSAITDRGGTVANVDRWGVRRFAYEINHQHEGYYFIVTFDGSEELPALLERLVHISDEFIRTKIVRPADLTVSGAAS